MGGSPYGSTNGVIMVLGCHYNPILGLYGLVLGDGIEAGTLFLPLRLVLAPDITVPHDRGGGVLGVEISQEGTQGGLLGEGAVIDGIALGVYTAHVGNVDGGGVVALYAVAHLVER